MKRSQEWPWLKHYDAEHIDRVALPIGGIGTGTISLGGRGDLRHFEIMGRPAKGFIPHGAFFALRAKAAGQEPVARVMEGPIPSEIYEGSWGSTAANHGLPRMQNAEFRQAYPLGQVLLSDPEMPLTVRLEAFNPLVPGDADASGYPVMVLRYVVKNPTRKSVEYAVAGTMPNLIGAMKMSEKPKGSRNRFLKSGTRVPYPTIVYDSTEVKKDEDGYGEMSLSLLEKRGVTNRTKWMHGGWIPNLLLFWEEFLKTGAVRDRGRIDPHVLEQLSTQHPVLGSLCAKGRIAPGQEKSVTFVVAWRFPNRRGWSVPKQDDCKGGDCCKEKPKPAFVGNYYSEQFKDTPAVLREVLPQLGRLEDRTVGWVEAFCKSDLPEAVKDAALANLSTLRTETCLRTPDGYLFGFEGCFDEVGCCQGSCTHVWNYENTIPFLFGDLARGMREVEFFHGLEKDGFMNFRIPLPLGIKTDFYYGAADGQLGTLMKVYREWRLCGDDAWLKKIWPKARQALEFCWIKGGWDADQDGVMEGCQHNTMDVEYYGPNPQMQGWYLGALRAAEEMARYLGEDDFAERCAGLFKAGSRKMDAMLFNGEYYEHDIQPIPRSKIDKRLYIHKYKTDSAGMPVNQLGKGCLVDQLVGHYMARVCGLGPLNKISNVRKTLRAIMKYNWRGHFWSHVNVLRSFVLQGESALLMASYDKVERPETPFPYFTEVMTGFEYTAAIGMLYEGQEKNGLKVIEAVRARYDGKHRSPFDEAECGHHYARAMAAWAAGLALSGFQYSAVEKSMTFTDKPGTYFWSNGYAWGTATVGKTKAGHTLKIEVGEGSVTLRTLGLGEKVQKDLSRMVEVTPRKALRVRL